MFAPVEHTPVPGSILPPEALEEEIRVFFTDLDAERFAKLGERLASGAEHADELTGAWLQGETVVARYLAAHQGTVTELVSRVSQVHARWLSSGVGTVSFLLHQTYSFGDVPRRELMTGSAVFVVEDGDLRMAMLHLGTASESEAPSELADLPTEASDLYAALSAPPSAGPTAPSPGSAVRRLRRQADRSLRTLAREANVSPGFLSQIERGLADPSMASLTRIAEALGVPPKALFDDDAGSPPFVLRAHQRREIVLPDSGMTHETLVPECAEGIEVWISMIPAGGVSTSTPTTHAGDELIIGLAGQLGVNLPSGTVALHPGDGVYVAAGTAHQLVADTAMPARFLSALALPSGSVPSERAGSSKGSSYEGLSSDQEREDPNCVG